MSKLYFYILSDSLGNTAEKAAKASIAQFDGLNHEIKKFPHIRSKAMLESIFEDIVFFNDIIIFYSLVDQKLKDELIKICQENNINHVDVLTDGVLAIQEKTSIQASTKPGALRRLDEDYFKRVNAIEFAVRYDDGKEPEGILDADVTILGVSRTSKTPLSMYMATKSHKVANLPLVPESAVAEEIFQVPSRKIVGLTNSPKNLHRIRTERLKSLGLPQGSSYTDMSRILEELEYADNIFKKIGCLVIDVSDKAIEETAEIIIDYLKKSNSKII